MKTIKEEKATIKEALDNPVHSRKLQELAVGASSATLVVNDSTRACPDDLLAPLIIRELESAGLTSRDILIIIATGLHTSSSIGEIIEIVGEDIASNYNVISHDAKASNFVNLGKTTQGVPIELNEYALKNDLLISTGIIEPHFFAGFSGGRKSILPGIASKKAIFAFHSFDMINHERTKAGILKGNPTHLAAREAAKAAGLDFIVNVIINKKGEVNYAVAGNPYLAFEKGVTKSFSLIGLKIREPADIVITSNSGYPLDQNLYQTVKGVYTASEVIRENGTIIIASECSKGIGSANFYKLQSTTTSPQELLNLIEHKETEEAQWQNQILCEILDKAEVYLISSLDDNLVKEMKINPVDSINQGLSLDFKKQGRNAKIIVIPEGPAMLPIYNQSRRYNM